MLKPDEQSFRGCNSDIVSEFFLKIIIDKKHIFNYIYIYIDKLFFFQFANYTHWGQANTQIITQY